MSRWTAGLQYQAAWLTTDWFAVSQAVEPPDWKALKSILFLCKFQFIYSQIPFCLFVCFAVLDFGLLNLSKTYLTWGLHVIVVKGPNPQAAQAWRITTKVKGKVFPFCFERFLMSNLALHFLTGRSEFCCLYINIFQKYWPQNVFGKSGHDAEMISVHMFSSF